MLGTWGKSRHVSHLHIGNPRQTKTRMSGEKPAASWPPKPGPKNYEKHGGHKGTSTVRAKQWDPEGKKACVNCHAHAECIANQRRQHLQAVAKFSDGRLHFWVQIKTPKRGPSKDIKEEMKMWSNSGPLFGVQIWTQKWGQIWTQKCGQPSDNVAPARRCFASRCATH